MIGNVYVGGWSKRTFILNVLEKDNLYMSVQVKTQRLFKHLSDRQRLFKCLSDRQRFFKCLSDE